MNCEAGPIKNTYLVTMVDKGVETISAVEMKSCEGALLFKNGSWLVSMIASGQWVKVEQQ